MAEISRESPVGALRLRVRVLHALQRHGCMTVGDVMAFGLSERVRGLGRSGLTEIIRRLELAGFAHPDRALVSEIDELDRRLERMERQVARIARDLTRDFHELRHSTRRSSGRKLRE